MQVRADAKMLADLLLRMLKYDPAQRPSARACLRHDFFQVCHTLRTHCQALNASAHALALCRLRSDSPIISSAQRMSAGDLSRDFGMERLVPDALCAGISQPIALVDSHAC